MSALIFVFALGFASAALLCAVACCKVSGNCSRREEQDEESS